MHARVKSLINQAINLCGCKRDGYQRTGCYNLDCPGFVQVNHRFVIGSPIKPFSSYKAKQYEIGITIYKVIYMHMHVYFMSIFAIIKFIF
jgi:hypothetical protein